MATTDRSVPARPGLGDREPGRSRPGGRWAKWWRGWFAPAQGLRPRPQDVLVAVVIAVVQVAGTIDYSQDEPPSPWAFDAFACMLLIAGPAALLFRRRWPEATLVVTFAAAAGYAASGYPRGPAGFPAFGFAVASAIMMGRSSLAWPVLVVAFAAFVWLTRKPRRISLDFRARKVRFQLRSCRTQGITLSTSPDRFTRISATAPTLDVCGR